MKSTLHNDSPRAVEGLDLRALRIAPIEARVLSRVDGVCTCTEIATSVGLSYAEVMRILGRLATLGAVRFDGAATSLAELSSPSVNARSGEYRLDPRDLPSGTLPARSPSEPAATTSAPPKASVSSMRPAVTPSEEMEQRKRALARKLGHSSLPPAGSSSPSVSPSRGSLEDAQIRLRTQLDHYIGLADAAAEKRDLISACNFLRLACSLTPRDLALADRLKALEQRAAAENWEKYADRGRREEMLGEWALAARSYERAALGHTSSELLERVAFCLLQARGDLKRAGDFAKRAVALSPQSIRCSLTALRYYSAAKLRTEALAELERARMLAPELPEVRDWTRRAAAGDL